MQPLVIEAVDNDSQYKIESHLIRVDKAIDKLGLVIEQSQRRIADSQRMLIKQPKRSVSD